MREQAIQQQIRLAVGAHPDVRLFRNNVGTGVDQRSGNFIRFGLANGSSDLIGIRRITIGPEHVGQQMAVFTSLEVKTANGRASTDQQNWLRMVRSFGGIAAIVRSTDDAITALGLDGNSPKRNVSVITKPAANIQ